MILGGSIPSSTKDFQNYVLKILRKDLTTGQILGAAGLMLKKPFRRTEEDLRAPAVSRVVEGAADGSESALPS